MDPVTLTGSMAAIITLTQQIILNLTPSHLWDTPLGKLETRAGEVLKEFGCLFSMFYAEQASNSDAPYSDDVARPLSDLIDNITLTLKNLEQEVVKLNLKSRFQRLLVHLDSHKLSRFEALLKQLENGRGTLQFLINKEQVRRLESITKSLTLQAPSTSAKNEKESMQYTTGIPDEIIASFLGALDEAMESGPWPGIRNTHKAKGRMHLKDNQLPTYEQAVRGHKDMRQIALHLAVTCGDIYAVETLLTAGVAMEAQDGLGETALHKAVRGGHLNVTKMLLEANVSPRIADFEGNTALHQAAYLGSVGTLGLLLRFGADVSAQNKVGVTPRKLARFGFDKLMDGMKRWNQGELSLSQDEGETLRDALGRYATAMELLSEAEISSKLETALSEATKSLGPITTRRADGLVTAEVSIRYPSDLEVLYGCAEQFYEVLDKLPNSGFAIGWNVLPSDIPWHEESPPVGFDVCEGEIETLWVEYMASEKLAPADVKLVADELATLIPDYLFAVFDSGPCGIGLVIGETDHGLADDELLTSDDEDFDDEDTMRLLLAARDHDISSELVGIQSSTLMLQGIRCFDVR